LQAGDEALRESLGGGIGAPHHLTARWSAAGCLRHARQKMAVRLQDRCAAAGWSARGHSGSALESGPNRAFGTTAIVPRGTRQIGDLPTRIILAFRPDALVRHDPFAVIWYVCGSDDIDINVWYP